MGTNTLKAITELDKNLVKELFLKPVISEYRDMKKEYLAAVEQPMDITTLRKRIARPERPPLFTWHDWRVRSLPSSSPLA